MIIAMSCTENWYKYLVVDLYSLLECTKNIKKIYLLLETDNVDNVKYLREIINKYEVNIEVINLKPFLDKNISDSCENVQNEFGYFALARLLLPDIIPEDKILYIDTDAIVRKDISPVWDCYDVSDYYVAGVKDYGVLMEDNYYTLGINGKYINSGFVIFNLKRIREEKIKDRWFELINTKKLKYPDQDALNLVCQYNELYIPSMYNSCECYGDRVTLEIINRELIKVYHYTGPKEQWVTDRFHSEEWYDAYEKFYTEFVIKK